MIDKIPQQLKQNFMKSHLHIVYLGLINFQRPQNKDQILFVSFVINVFIQEQQYNVSVNFKDYICKTCYNSVKKPHIQTQVVCNKLEIFCPAPLPHSAPNRLERLNLNRLERILISRRILFKKVAVMPRGQFPKLKGEICNIPFETADITSTLLRGVDSNGLLLVKLKSFVVMCIEAVSPDSVYANLAYLKKANYRDININIDVFAHFVGKLSKGQKY